mgnify:CR=1 FL=1
MAIGNPVTLTSNVASKTISATATASQTLFTVTGGYRINQLSVFRNGTRLVDALNYTARDGSTVTLLSPAAAGDVLEFQVFDDFRVADALNVNSGGTVNGNVNVVGVVSASNIQIGSAITFSSGGVNVTGIVTASGLRVGTAVTISAGVVTAVEYDILGSTNTLNVGGLSVGVATATTATITTLNSSSGLVSVGTTIKTRGFVETQNTVSIAGTILTLDASQGTVFTHTTSAQIGIVSFTGIRTDTAGTQTFTVLVTQGATPVNTTGATGIGTVLASIRISPGNVGYSTHIKVGGGSSITLTNSAGALDLLTFIVSYDGATSIANTSFKVVGFAATDFRNAIV